MILRRILVIAVVCGLPLCHIYAVPAKRSAMTVRQPDGTEITVRLHGDEHFHYLTTEAGHIVAKDSAGRYTYAQVNGGHIEPTTETVRPGGTIPDVAVRAETVAAELAQIRRRAASERGAAGTKSGLLEVNQAERGLVLLVNFSDVKFVTDDAGRAFDDMLNSEGYSANGATGSAADYFRASSSGQYHPHFDVFGPYDLDRRMSYYGGNDYMGNDRHPDQMVVDALAKLMADGEADVDMADYDADNDGKIDFVFVYYAGHNEAEGADEETIWPHSWEVYPQNVEGGVQFGGKTVSKYACTSELKDKFGYDMCGIGTFCHEFSHVLGLPDLYTTDGATHKTLDSWDVMDYGPYNNDGRTPPVFSSYERFFMGWLTPDILDSDGDYRLDDLQTSNRAYLISGDGTHNLDGVSPYPEAFYLLEYRAREGWDAYLPESGMLVTKVNFSETKWYTNVVNNDPDNMGVDLIEADGIGYGSAKPGDVFPGSAGVSNCTLFDSCQIYDIAEEDGGVSFSFTFAEYIDVNTPAPKPCIAGNKICNLISGAELSCFTVDGHTVWTAVAEGAEYEFVPPHGVYCIVVRQDGKKFSLKGVNPQ